MAKKSKEDARAEVFAKMAMGKKMKGFPPPGREGKGSKKTSKKGGC